MPGAPAGVKRMPPVMRARLSCAAGGSSSFSRPCAIDVIDTGDITSVISRWFVPIVYERTFAYSSAEVADPDGRVKPSVKMRSAFGAPRSSMPPDVAITIE